MWVIVWIMPATLGLAGAVALVQSCCGPRPRHDDAPRYRRRRDRPPILTGRTPHQLPKPPGEGPQAGKPNHHADLGNGEVRMHQEILGPLHPPPTEIRPRRLPEDVPKLPNEVVPREPSGSGHVVEVERIRVPGIHEIPSPPKVHHPLTPHTEDSSAPTLVRKVTGGLGIGARRGEEPRARKAAWPTQPCCQPSLPTPRPPNAHTD